jgi:hypothetical protein
MTGYTISGVLYDRAANTSIAVTVTLKNQVTNRGEYDVLITRAQTLTLNARTQELAIHFVAGGYDFETDPAIVSVVEATGVV